MIRLILVAVALAGLAVAQAGTAPRTADSFVPPDHVGEAAVDCTALRECGLLDELRARIEQSPLAGLEQKIGLSFADLRRLRVFFCQGPERNGEPDRDAVVAIFEGNDKVVLPAADAAHRVDKLAGHDVLVARDAGEDPPVCVGIAPGLLVYGQRRLVEPLLDGTLKPGVRAPEVQALMGGQSLLAHVAMVFPPVPAAAAGTPVPRIGVARLSRKAKDDGHVLALEIVVRFARDPERIAKLVAELQQRQQQLANEQELAPYRETLAKVALQAADLDLIGRVELRDGRELVDTLVTLVPAFIPVTAMSAEAKVTKASTDVRTIHDAAKLYRIMHGGWPTLEQLVTPDDKGKQLLQSVPQDPWGHDYVLRVVDGGRFEVVSLGPDGVEATEDDITSLPTRPKDGGR